MGGRCAGGVELQWYRVADTVINADQRRVIKVPEARWRVQAPRCIVGPAANTGYLA